MSCEWCGSDGATQYNHFAQAYLCGVCWRHIEAQKSVLRFAERARLEREEAAERARQEAERAEWEAAERARQEAERAEWDRKDWQRAQSEDTIEAYKKYLAPAPGDYFADTCAGKFVAEAKARLAAKLLQLEREQWSLAMHERTSEAYERYLRLCPDGVHVADAKSRLDQLQWASATQEETIASLERYVLLCPWGVHVGEANAKLDAKRWLSAFKEGTILAYDQYLAVCPNGKHVAEATAERARLDEASWRLTQNEGTIEAYERYIANSAAGSHISEAKQFLSSKLRDMLLADLKNTDLRRRYLKVRTEKYQKRDKKMVPQPLTTVLLVVAIIIGGVLCLACSWLGWWWQIGVLAPVWGLAVGLSVLRDKSAKFGLLPSDWYFFSESELQRRIDEARVVADKAREAKDREQVVQDRALKLEKLKQSFFAAVTNPDRQAAGYSLQDMLQELFSLFEIEYRKSFRNPKNTQEIDGHFCFHSFDYLVEAKWRKDQPTEAEIGSFKHKIDGKMQATRGLFVSVPGFRKEVVEKFDERVSSIILMDGADLTHLLEGRVDLRDGLRAKIEAAAQRGVVLTPIVG